MNNEYISNIGARIRIFRKTRGYTLDVFSQLVHKSKSILSKYERGDVTIDIVTLKEIADALQVPVTALLYTAETASSSIFVSGIKPVQHEQERYFAYSIMSRGKATLQKSLLILDKTTATAYMNIRSEKDTSRYDTMYTGEVKRRDSFTRALLTNVLNQDDIHIIELPPRLGSHQCCIAFVVTLSVGSNYPMAGSFLLSKVPITDQEWIIQTLAFTKEDLKIFQFHNAYYSIQNHSARIVDIRNIE